MDENVDITALIKKNVPRLSKSHKKLANEILENFQNADFSSAAKISEYTGVSEATVLRFATELGYCGYQKFQEAIDGLVRRNLTTVQRMKAASEKIQKPKKSILESVMERDAERIKRTIAEIDEEVFTKAVDALLEAEKIYILAGRSSSSLASYMGFYFNLMFEDIKLINATSAGEMFEEIHRIGKNDIVVGISFPRYSQKTLKAIQYAKEKDAKIIALTDSLKSPMKRYADYCLVSGSDMVSFVDSLVAPMSVINALIVAVSMRKKDELSKTLDSLENIWKEYRTFMTNDDLYEN